MSLRAVTYCTGFTLGIILLLPSGVSASSFWSAGSQRSYFVVPYHKDQGDVVTIRVTSPSELPISSTLPTHNTSLVALYHYDILLPYVNYQVKDPQKFHSQLARAVTEKTQANHFQKNQLTPAQLLIVTGQIVATTMQYDKRMVSSDPSYDLKHDDVISAMPLDQVFLNEKKGVCRQYAALYAAIAQYIIDTSGSPALQGVKVDEVISNDFTHAYDVAYVTTSDVAGQGLVTATFVDPTTMTATAPLISGNAFNRTHDALFSEFIKSGRYHWTDAQRDELLRQLAGYAETGDVSVMQAQDELLHQWLSHTTEQSLLTTVRQTVLEVPPAQVVRLSQSKDNAAKKIAARYATTLKAWHMRAATESSL